MNIRLEYNPEQGWPWHFATKHDIPNTFGWRTIRENISEPIATDFVNYAMRHNLHKSCSAQQMKQEFADWFYLHH